VAATAGSEEKLETCRSLGADITVNYREDDFVAVLRDAGGADVILDNMGASYLMRNLQALKTEGRLVVIGMQGGSKAEIDLSVLLRKRAALVATTLRARPSEEKSAICAALVEHVWPLVAEGTVKPVVHERVPLADVARAHQAMDDSSHVGKILLTT
jgi:NADPH:quinone reductase-like Zn-dependent oxidoreductase